MGEFIRLLLHRRFRFDNPFRFWTKAEMCKTLLAEGLGNLVKESITCGRIRREKDRGRLQCGICTSCLLRRHALYAAEMAALDSPNYHFDITNHQRKANQDQLYELYAMLDQVNVFRNCIQSRKPWEELQERFPNLGFISEHVASHLKEETWLVKQSFIGMFQRYIDEWTKFPLCEEICRRFLIEREGGAV